MPTYEYECDACGNRFDEFQSFSDKVLKKCPKCKKAKLRRLFGTGSAILFKGSGFYETDYRSDNYQKGAKADKDSSEKKDAPAKDTTSDKKTESPPAATPAPKSKKKD
ncbi:MAG: zinc ribbon domain-containing protein [Gemmataceae bacterium]|nr:zinc ribbon domain-containing protein [Gemmataceae bacterium]